jgi:hypothetical protein
MLLAVTQGELAERVVTVSLAMGIAAFLTGVVLMVIDWLSERELRKATRQAGQQLGVASAQGQGLAIPGVGEAVNALANLAKALKEAQSRETTAQQALARAERDAADHPARAAARQAAEAEMHALEETLNQARERSTRLLLAAMVFLAIAAVGALVKP